MVLVVKGGVTAVLDLLEVLAQLHLGVKEPVLVKLIADAESYLKAHFNQDYYQKVVASCGEEKVQAQAKYRPLTAGVMKHRAMNTTAMARYRPLRSRKLRGLKVY